MNRRQKLVQQQFLDNEEAVIKRLEQVYGVALKDINDNIEKLMKRFDPDTGDLPQSVIYQIKYQEMVKAQVEGILKELQTKQFLSVSEYLDLCYEDGFVGALFDLHGQDVPMALPLNQESMVKAVQLDSKISKGLYTRLGEDVDLLKKKITAQVSRSIATGTSFAQCAKQLANYTRIGYNNAIRIARTEGHRIQCSATHDAAQQAKDRGADIVKKWDATLDGKTRESHVAVDGQIREVDEPFSNGLMYPGDPAGSAAEVINCRCGYLQKARRWLDGSFTKVNNFTKQIESFDSPQDYEEFKKGFFSPENKKFMNYAQQMEDKYGTRDWNKVLEQMSDREYKHYSKLLANNPMFNVKAPVKVPFTPATLDDFPRQFYKSAPGKKATNALVEVLNGNPDMNPNVRKLYTNMNDLPHVPWDGKVSYTMDGHALDTWYRRSTGETTKYSLKIPQMKGDDLRGQNGVAFHEIGHYIDMGFTKKDLRSQQYGDLTDAIRKAGSGMSKEVRDLFDDFASQYTKVRDDLAAQYSDIRKALSAEYRVGAITYSEYTKKWNASIRDQDRERDYMVRNLLGGNVDMLSDIYDALSGGAHRDNNDLIYGHGGKYYSNIPKRNSETFANYMTLCVNRPDLVELLRKDKPELCEALDNLIEEMAGELK